MSAENFERSIFLMRVEMLAKHLPLRQIERALEPYYTFLAIMRENEAEDKERAEREAAREGMRAR